MVVPFSKVNLSPLYVGDDQIQAAVITALALIAGNTELASAINSAATQYDIDPTIIERYCGMFVKSRNW